MSVYTEICDTFRITPAKGESAAAFAKRATAKINKLADSDWERMSEALQLWNRSYMEAQAEKKDLPELEGFPASDEPESGDASGGGSEEASAEIADNAEEPEDGVDPEDGIDEGGEAEDAEEARWRSEMRALSKKGPGPKKTTKGSVKLPAKGKAPAKAKATPKPAKKAAAKAKGPGPGRPLGLAPTARIKLLVKENPHRAGTGRFKRWLKYRNNMTVQEALDAGLNPGNLRHSLLDGHIEVK